MALRETTGRNYSDEGLILLVDEAARTGRFQVCGSTGRPELTDDDFERFLELSAERRGV
jgi:hypothetical protein